MPSMGEKRSKWQGSIAIDPQNPQRASEGEIKLNHLIYDLQKLTFQQGGEVGTQQRTSVRTIRNRLRFFLRHLNFHYLVILLVIADLVLVLIDLVLGMFTEQNFQLKFFPLAQLSSPCLTEDEMKEYNITIQRDSCILPPSVQLRHAELFLFYFSLLLLALFVLEVFTTFFAFGLKFCKSPLYLLDSIIVLSSFVMEVYFHYGNVAQAGRAASAMILLRSWKIVRAVHAVAHSITIKNRLLIERIQEAQVLLEKEKHQAEETLKNQEIQLSYFVRILSNMGKLPSKEQIEMYIQESNSKL